MLKQRRKHNPPFTSAGVTFFRGPLRLRATSRLSCSSLGSGPSWLTPTSSAAAKYFRTVSLDSPVPDAMCR